MRVMKHRIPDIDSANLRVQDLPWNSNQCRCPRCGQIFLSAAPFDLHRSNGACQQPPETDSFAIAVRSEGNIMYAGFVGTGREHQHLWAFRSAIGDNGAAKGRARKWGLKPVA
jgi:hypothetical protein